MRLVSALLAATLLTAPALAAPTAEEKSPAYEVNTYRFGYPYRSERGTTAEACEQMCNRDGSCAVWSLTPATFKVGPRCELKRAVGSATARPGAISGVANRFQPDPIRTGPMQYTGQAVPDSRQPPPRPAGQVPPSPLPPGWTPVEPEQSDLMGGPEQSVSVVKRPRPATTLAVRGPAQGTVPSDVKQPAPVTFATPTRLAPKPVASAGSQPRETYSAVLKRPSTRSVPAAQTPPGPPPPVTAVPQFEIVPADRGPAPDVETVATAPLTSPGGVQIEPAAPIRKRVPWTERDTTSPDYSVGEAGYIPGDEDASAGFVDAGPDTGN